MYVWCLKKVYLSEIGSKQHSRTFSCFKFVIIGQIKTIFSSNCTLQLHTQTPHITYTNPKSYTNPKANLFCCFKFYQSYSITLILPSTPRATFLASGSRVRSKDIIYNLIVVIYLAICYIWIMCPDSVCAQGVHEITCI